MKKYLLVLAALSMSGCAYGNYKNSYLQEYAGHDCSALDSELNGTHLELERLRQARRYMRGIRYGPHIWREIYGAEDWQTVEENAYQKFRMRNHAQQQAIRQLASSQGCRSVEAPLS